MNKCEFCKKEFEVKINTKGRFCGYSCYWQVLKGKRISTKTEFKKGVKPWNTGGYKENLRYNSIHRWVQNNFVRLNKCELCGTIQANNYEWANKDGRYTRIRSDWMRLCISCHRRMDLDNPKEVNWRL